MRPTNIDSAAKPGSAEMSGLQPLSEVERYLAAHPETDSVEFLITDTNGVLRGKWAPRSAIEKAFTQGVNFPLSMFGLDIWGREVMETGLHVDTGDRDGFAMAVPGSLRPVPWAPVPTAQAILTMQSERRVPFHGDPRTRLEAVVERLASAGFAAVVAVELEFYLVDPRVPPRPSGMPTPVLAGEPGPDRQSMYALSDLSTYSAFFGELKAAARAQGLPIDTIVKEAAPGQFEVNLKHRRDAVAAADDSVMLKRLVIELARVHGLRATFMAKPYMEWAGSGMHVHVSLVDAAGDNVFADPGYGEARLGAAVAGLLEAMIASTLVFVPSWNGFRRLKPGSYAPTRVTWGHNNRSVAVRVPASDASGRRLEHRIAGADANPYLVVAAILAGMLDGMERGLTPPPPVDRNAYDEPGPSLPSTMAEAIALFERSDFIRRAFGVEYRALFAAVKTAEMAAFGDEITPLERSTYL